MKIQLLYDYQLRGAVLENGARILLRREHSNNFIFCCRYFDSIEEIVQKYRLDYSDIIGLYSHIKRNGMHTDLIEFVLADKIERKIISINLYDVKSRVYNSRSPYVEMCKSNYDFMMDMKTFGCDVFIIELILYPNWIVEMNIERLDDIKLRVYDSSEKRTVSFQKGT
jgi:hypothetical protein